MKYEYIRTCHCGHIESIEVSRREAAFGLKEREIWAKKCPQCHNTRFATLGHPEFDIEMDLLIEWGNNPNYFFMEQDEDLLLAEEKYIDIILDLLDNYKILDQKRNVLMEALCVIIYDNSVSDTGNSALIDRVVHELRKRKTDLLNAQNWIMDYIKKVTFPIIGIENLSNNKTLK